MLPVMQFAAMLPWIVAIGRISVVSSGHGSTFKNLV